MANHVTGTISLPIWNHNLARQLVGTPLFTFADFFARQSSWNHKFAKSPNRKHKLAKSTGPRVIPGYRCSVRNQVGRRTMDGHSCRGWSITSFDRQIVTKESIPGLAVQRVWSPFSGSLYPSAVDRCDVFNLGSRGLVRFGLAMGPAVACSSGPAARFTPGERHPVMHLALAVLPLTTAPSGAVSLRSADLVLIFGCRTKILFT